MNHQIFVSEGEEGERGRRTGTTAWEGGMALEILQTTEPPEAAEGERQDSNQLYTLVTQTCVFRGNIID